MIVRASEKRKGKWSEQAQAVVGADLAGALAVAVAESVHLAACQIPTLITASSS